VLLRVTGQSPALRAGRLEQQLHWQELLTPLVATRMNLPATSTGPIALTAAALACLNVANVLWLNNNGTESLGRLVDDAMRAVQPGF
jgi:hypothetical protein